MTPTPEPARPSDAAPIDAARAEPLGGILLAVARLTRRIGARRPFAGTPLSRSQFDAVFLLAHAVTPVTPSALAAELGVTGGAVTQLVEGLREAGLVEVARHPTDGRSRVLALSAAAAQEVDAFQQGLVRDLAPDFAALDEAELRQLATLLARATAR
ncbi:MarR family winged helix-turn-helix transcriptional regulator [Microcella daejeonensis]|uniref:MarR family winged helix-turn-helix transcriptional regulator n=1 Tax=Microcella daejeonensis TaxID=2994971 RepID=UPI00227008C6|nr:MarR family winged helix-turn-helix transcriptional regulator [Microcella daejeonensis]WAB84623.1 MarR family winged helix-turn-helix transcriptional regulator [Microcella daejeonensis]